ncbi:dipeptide ABC transporter ATP-binding protein [Anaerolineales bacterium HSG24]|nr:dipeptide ABC transporter ATP-binding protein [Anaerolineales bacterium HSG24]
MANNGSNNVLVSVKNLKKFFPIKQGFIFNRQVTQVKAVNDISFEIKQGETLGLVGESGCGKSTTGRAVLQLHKPTSGHVFYEDQDLTTLSEGELRALRPKIQMIFQDSIASLNPRHSVRKIIGEPLVIHNIGTAKTIHNRVVELMELVGLNPKWMKRFPHEFSGGQRQRINIARALALNPRFVVCDEPISALDVSIQAQVVNLLKDLQQQLGLTYLFIAHDLSMVQYLSDRVAVMYLGKAMELADKQTLFKEPLHPYTQSLMSAVPLPQPKLERKRKRIILQGEVPSPSKAPNGCVFHTRCPLAIDRCAKVIPEYRQVHPDHFVACHLVDDQQSSIIKVIGR